jgi:hypothetical protein
MPVGHLDRQDDPWQARGDVEPLPADQAAGKCQALGAVVVAGGQDDRDFEVEQQAREELVHDHRGLDRRHRPVINVAAYGNDPDFLVTGYGDDLLEDMRLVVGQVNVVKDLAEVQVGQVENAHGSSLNNETIVHPEQAGWKETSPRGIPKFLAIIFP